MTAERRGAAVVLLHGLGRTRVSLALAARRLRREGLEPVPIGYPSRRRPIEELAAYVRERLPRGRSPLHFVTHSMGGIVLRCMLAAEPLPELGRVVMLAPPNRGSRLAKRLRDTPGIRHAMGPALRQLADDEDGLPGRLPPVDFELGVIVGNRSINPMGRWVDGESDGKVGVDEARVEGMVDFLVVPRGHTFIMNDPAVIEQALHFLRHGRFDQPDSGAT